MSSSCYLCALCDPHEVCQTSAEVYGTTDALRLDDANHAAGIDLDPDSDPFQLVDMVDAPDDNDEEAW